MSWTCALSPYQPASAVDANTSSRILSTTIADVIAVS
jgi:hypothetical protein